MRMRLNVTMKVEDMQDKTVLVFLQPPDPQHNHQIHAWRVLAGSAGAAESFDYAAVIPTDVTSDGDKPGNTIVSGRQIVAPGQLFSATSPEGLSPAPCGVIDQTNPFTRFPGSGYVNDRPVVTMSYVDRNMTAGIEHLPNRHATAAPEAGQTDDVRLVPDRNRYPMPSTATEVDALPGNDRGR